MWMWLNLENPRKRNGVDVRGKLDGVENVTDLQILKLRSWKEIVATGKQALPSWKRQDVDVAQPRKSPKDKWC
ncbi:hypothetical protein ACOMHN_029028 [Nucella lapillus]